LAALSAESSDDRTEKWGRVLRGSAPGLDPDGRPILLVHKGEDLVSVGVSRSNLLTNDAGERFTQGLLEARLRAELKRGSSPKVSENDVERDWDLLQKALNGSASEPTAMPSGSQSTARNRQ
jgi:hypothetical protein